MKLIIILILVALVSIIGLTACDSRSAPASVLPTLVPVIPTATPLPVSDWMPTAIPGSALTPVFTAVSTEEPYRWSYAGSLVSMNAMTFISDYEAWAVGDYGYIAHWEGALGWKHVRSPTETALYAVSFISPDDGWSVGDGGHILHWDGKEWTVFQLAQSTYLRGRPLLHTVGFASPDNGWAFGCIDTEGGSGIWGLHWDGQEWQDIPNMSRLHGSLCLTAMTILSSDNIWVAGGGDRGITLHWNGSQWQDVPNPAGYWLYSIDAVSSDSIWAAGVETTPEGYAGVVIHWNGTAWSKVELPSTGWINDVVGLADNDVWIGGDTLLRWDGREWREYEKPLMIWDRIVDIEISPDGQVWALSRYGEFLRLGTVAR